MAHALLFDWEAPPVWDVRKKWQFWTIVNSSTNLYGVVPLLLNSTRAESMFERHSTEQTSQAQPRLQENKNEALTGEL
jgi:hypothetical protein